MGASFSTEVVGHRDDTVRALEWVLDALEEEQQQHHHNDAGGARGSSGEDPLSKKGQRGSTASAAAAPRHPPQQQVNKTGSGAITHLCLPAQGIDDAAAVLHAAVLARCADLETLDLSSNGLTAAGVAAVISAGVAPLVAQQALEFAEATALGALWLRREAAMRAEADASARAQHGAAAVGGAKLIPSDAHHIPTLLSVLRLSGNQFGSASTLPPAGVVGAEGSTEQVPLPPGVTSAGVASLCALLGQDQGLEQLVLYNCALTDADVLALVNAALLHPRLHTLNVGANAQLSTRSVLVLAEFAKRCQTLRSVVVGDGVVVDVDVEPTGAGAAALTAAPQMVQAHAPPALVSAAAALHEALVANRARHVEEAHRRADADARRAARLTAEVQRRDAAAREKAAARAAIDAELAALQRDKEEQERAIGEIRAVLNAKAATEAESRRQRTQAQQDDTVRQAVADAYAWRERRTAGGSYEREYRAGFTTLRMVHGTDPVTGRPTDHLEPVEGPPRRLRPCTAEGCELHGKLHYHCRHEAEGAALQLRQLQKAQAKERAAAAAAGVAPALADRPPPYVGCRATGHICATVGFYARPLPDTTAAHFFASAHPTAAQ